MISYWISRVGSSIPRGFSRRYILDLLTEQPMTGKEIINKAIVQSHGKWRPSPGLIYPMLGRLLEEELISELDNGRYKITSKGLDMAANVESIHSVFQKQMDLIFRIGNVGKFMTMDMLDRLSIIGSTLSSNLDKMTEEEQNKYRQFLLKELKKLENENENSYSNRQNISLG
jgi:DNA-binding PadR family transcriptional regulator